MGKDTGVRSYEDLVDEAAAADVSGWGWEWLQGRATEDRPPWRYAQILAQEWARAGAALDIDTGGGEVLAEALATVIADGGSLPARRAATEGWPPNTRVARGTLGRYGVGVRHVEPGEPLPFPNASFDLVTSRHPVRPDWAEIARVLQPGGSYVAQHVGHRSASELVEWFLGPQPRGRDQRDPVREGAAAQAAGLIVPQLRLATSRMEFFDIGAVVWVLRKCVWWVPDFTVESYDRELRALDARIRAEGPFVAYSTRHLLRCVRPA